MMSVFKTKTNTKQLRMWKIMNFHTLALIETFNVTDDFFTTKQKTVSF